MNALQEMLRDAREQWQTNARLRLACLAVLAILWGYGLLLLSDQTPSQLAKLADLRRQTLELRSLQDAAQWEARLGQAMEQSKAAKALTWVETRPGLAQAEVQDWLRASAGKAGLAVRDLSVAVASNEAAAVGSSQTEKTTGVIALRLSADFTPLALSSLLFELGQVERGLSVRRLQLKTWTTPQQAEIDVQVRVSSPSEKP
ncbi:hypothetical protein [Roseateles sp.]|jgi:hypothetical protein|uniref:hypothetical protein n=1 Tax=Roseateles sp. TaxID=1971397 RepID=UPI0037C9D9F7